MASSETPNLDTEILGQLQTDPNVDGAEIPTHTPDSAVFLRLQPTDTGSRTNDTGLSTPARVRGLGSEMV